MSAPATRNQRELAEEIAALRQDTAHREALFAEARCLRDAAYGPRVFLRGLLEISSYCKQNCLYCGLRRENKHAERYRLTDDSLLACCREGYALGFRSFVLQGGEDDAFSDRRLCGLVDAIKTACPASAVTLSLGERSPASYRALRDAGADRYLLRHETADAAHFAALHPPGQTAQSRQRCLYTLKEQGWQVGAGLMVGSPWQEDIHLAADLLFLQELEPEMVGIGPFLPQQDTPFAGQPRGSLGDTLLMLALTRLLLPQVLLPATTALGSIHPTGREKGFAAGANVVMPNLSPPDVRDAYRIYDGKLHSGAEAAEGLNALCRCIRSAGLEPSFTRGDHASFSA